MGWECATASPNFQVTVSLLGCPWLPFLYILSSTSHIEAISSLLSLRTQHTAVQRLALIIIIYSNERNAIFSSHLTTWDCAVDLFGSTLTSFGAHYSSSVALTSRHYYLDALHSTVLARSRACKACRSNIGNVGWNPLTWGMEVWIFALVSCFCVFWKPHDRLVSHRICLTKWHFIDLKTKKTWSWSNPHFSTFLKIIIMDSV